MDICDADNLETATGHRKTGNEEIVILEASTDVGRGYEETKGC